jgi:hypothetical protein
MHPAKSGQFDVVDVLPRTLPGSTDQLRLVQAIGGLSKGIVERLTG